ncbi:MAG: amidohydrolase family protein [Gemmatimonadota bacterium]|jgi:predicted TIM-barrel fold metal-dependent hydrolase
MNSHQTDSTASAILDVHHHMVPPAYLEALASAGLDGKALRKWTPERSLQMMDRFGVKKALLSLSSPGVWLGNDGEARTLARACNEYGASLARKYPGRFGVLAALPFPDLEGAVTEVVYALDTLKVDGVILFSNVQGDYVGDPEFDPLMATLEERRALVLLHPNSVPEDAENAALYPWAEYPIDLARAWARMALHDTLVRYPGIRWILGHAGGVVPFMANRLGKAHYAKVKGLRWGRILKDLILKRNGGLELAKGVMYDTVGATNSVSYVALRELVGPGQIRFGSNFPWESEAGVEASIGFLSGWGGGLFGGLRSGGGEGGGP